MPSVSYMPLGHDFCLAPDAAFAGYSSVGRARSRPWKMAEMLPIHDAAINGDLEGLTRELERGVSPDIPFGQGGLAPLHLVITNNVIDVAINVDNRLACVRLLIDAGANVSGTCSSNNMTALMYAAVSDHPRFVTILLNAGADPNQRDDENWTPLHYAIYSNRAADSIRNLINAGAAVDARCEAGRTPLDLCIDERRRELHPLRGDPACSERRHRLYPVLLRAGAALPAETDDADSESDDAESDRPTSPDDADFFRKVRAAGSFQKYERAHLTAIAATFAPKFTHLLPPELVRRVVEFAFHVGDY